MAEEIAQHIALMGSLAGEELSVMEKVATRIADTLNAGRKLIALGNGGSAADAEHFVAELVGRFRADRKPLAAIALTSNTSSITAIANDYGFENVFGRQLEGLASPGDTVFAISTSGNSLNVLRALESARRLGLTSIGLTGRRGHRMRDIVDYCLCVPSDSTARIQEAHILIIHILTAAIESALVSTRQLVSADHTATNRG